MALVARYHFPSPPTATLVLLITQSFKGTKMREVSNGMMFKQFMGVPLLDYFTETSPCQCT